MKKILFLILLLILAPVFVFGIDCPHGLINDKYPGQCRLYQDINKDGYCDLSEVEGASLKSKTGVQEKGFKTPEHQILPITIVSIFAYLTSLYLVRKNKISVLKHRKFWNWILLLMFLPTLLTTFLLMLKVEYGILIKLGFNLNFAHIVFGWTFLLICVFHIVWHLNYYFFKKVG